MRNVCIILFCATLIACGKSSPKQQSYHSLASMEDLSKNEMWFVNCNGEGTDFSGEYQFIFKDMKSHCDVNSKATAIKDKTVNFKCIQNNRDFKCKYPGEKQARYQGCISKDGEFRLEAKGLTNMPENPEEGKERFWGEINSESGKYQSVTTINDEMQRNGYCAITASLEVQIQSQ